MTEEPEIKEWTGPMKSFKLFYIGARGKLHIAGDMTSTESQCGRVLAAEAKTGELLLPRTGKHEYSHRGHMSSAMAAKFCKQCRSAYNVRLSIAEGHFTGDYPDHETRWAHKWQLGENEKELFQAVLKGKPVNKDIKSPKVTSDEMYIKDKQLEEATAIILQGIDTNKIVDLTSSVVMESIKTQTDALQASIEREISKNTKTLEVKPFPEAPTIKIENTHKDFESLINLLSGGMNVLLVGPSGSFKTTSAKMASEALDLEFSAMSLGPTITESKVFGYNDANGKYSTTAFREAYENGGCFLFDEFDAGHPSVLVTLNAALENGFCQFPDAMIKRHENFVAIASANTFGRGADRVYNGRNQLDGATLERFVVLDWGYDEDLEHVISGNKEWTYNVQSIRAACEELKIRHIVSPRASILGARLLASKHFVKKQVEEMLIWKGLDRDAVLKIKRRAKEIYQDKTGTTPAKAEAGADSGHNPFA